MSILSKKAMLVAINISVLNVKKTDKAISNEVLIAHNANSDAGQFEKFIFPKSLINPISTAAQNARNALKMKTVAWLDEGWRLLPSKSFLKVRDEMVPLLDKFNAAKDSFLSNYQDRIDEQKTRLNGLFKETDYPTLSAMQKKFAIKLNFAPVPEAADFRCAMLDSALKEAQEELSERLSDAEKLVKDDLISRLRAPLAHLVAQLQKDDGRIFQASLDNIDEIIRAIPELNIVGNSQLNAIAKAAKVVTEVDASRLRDSDIARAATVQSANDIMKQLDGCF